MVEADRIASRIDTEPLAHGVDDPEVRLVRDQQGNLVDRDIGLLQHPVGGLDCRAYRFTENLAAFHLNEAALVAIKDRSQGPVQPEIMREDQRLALGGLHDDGTGSVGEDHGGGPVFLVGDLRQGVRADDKCPVVSRIEQCDGGHEPVHEAGTGCIQVECGTPATELVVDRRRGCGHGLIGCRRREH